MPIDQIIGPLGLTVAAVYAIKVLWADHQRSDADDRRERDEWKALALRLAGVAEAAVTRATEKP